MNTKKWTAALLMAAMTGSAWAQANQPAKTGHKEFDEFREGIYEEFNQFRKEIIMEFCEFVGDPNRWKTMMADPAQPMPEEKSIQPQLAPGADEQTASWFSKLFGDKGDNNDKDKKKKKKDKEKQKRDSRKDPVKFEVKEVLKPAPRAPQAKPQVEAKQFNSFANDYMEFTVFGTVCKVRIGNDCKFQLANLEPRTLANAIERYTEAQFENLLYDCLQERKNHNFSDWAYFQMLKVLTDKFYGPNSNVGMLTRAFLYSQSGYKMRLAHDGKSLYMLACTRHFIYNKPFYTLDGEWYFLLDGKEAESLRICDAKFAKESSLSLQISAEQYLTLNPTMKRTLRSKKNPDFVVTISSNKNYIDFFDTYPSSTLDNNYMTRWAMYAETPLEKGIRDQLYSQMRPLLQGLSQLDAVQQLLWWTQGSIDMEGTIKDADCLMYRYDEDVWGTDRAFFAEETLFYPYNDCEDRSILLSHLVRDLVGLDVVLVHYPGHLAMAVNFTENVGGDYIELNGQKFVVCDPTYIGARVGETMPMVQGLNTTVILLKRDADQAKI